ncbi:glycosyltransferase [Paenibacillus luteus]|uniref:glycosyltransferase n=1 Tax=Paenibacillus luteus TaxID=2545753 RepID=UPI0011451AB2|nr:glycosyltransferase [Paenibacillus luteus]
MRATTIVLLAQHAPLLKICITNIIKHTRLPYELIVVNDGNSAAITNLLEEQMDTSIRMITTPVILGVAAGYNLGASLASNERIVFLRDNVIVTKQWLQGLNKTLDEYPRAAITGPLSNGISGSQNISTDIGTVLKMTIADRKAALAPQGASERTTRLLSFLLMVRKEMFEHLGGFDERFALESYEDDDLCYRALKEGYYLYISKESFVHFTSPPPLFEHNPSWYSKQLEANRQAGINKWGADLTELLLNFKQPVTVSLCMIVKNEEETLERCLSSVADLVHEINIVDTGSTDKTKEIAARFTSRIFDFQWVDDFSRARNYAFTQATQEYILWLDADDVILQQDREKLSELFSAMPLHADSVSMHYHLNRDEYGNVTSSLRRNRLVRRTNGFRWIGIVHEYLQVQGTIINSDIAVTHSRVHNSSSRNLQIYQSKMSSNVILSPRDTYYYANELFDHGEWESAAIQYEKLLEFTEVWIEDQIGACGRAAECYFNLGRLNQAKLKATQSFSYALPRAENCCRMGQFYLSENCYQEAICWYRLATELDMPTDSSALLLHSCWTWLPHLQLCVCYDRLGDYKLAYQENERAAEYIPNDKRILSNRAYLYQRIQKGE